MRKTFAQVGLLAIGLANIYAANVHAQETTTYSYDAKGRVTGVTRSGGPSNGVSTTYSHDPADNRSSVVVTGSQGSAPGGGGDGAATSTSAFAVVPLLGGTPIYIR